MTKNPAAEETLSYQARMEVERERFRMMVKLVKLFAFERTVYVIVTTVSLLVLVSCAALLLLTRNIEVGVFGTIFSSGGIVYSSGQVLKMFNSAMRVIVPEGDL